MVSEWGEDVPSLARMLADLGRDGWGMVPVW